MADQLRDPRLLHGDPVEQIGHLDGPGMVGDEDELGSEGKLPDEGGKAIDVQIVQGSIHLVQHDKGAGSRGPQGHEEGDGPEGLLTAREE